MVSIVIAVILVIVGAMIAAALDRDPGVAGPSAAGGAGAAQEPSH